MKRILITSFLAFLFIGCGSTSVSSGNSSASIIPIPNGKAYRLYDYLTPASNQNIKNSRFKDGKLLEVETLEYQKKSDTLVSLFSHKNLGGRIEYKQDKDNVLVTLYDSSEKDPKTFKLNNFLDSGDVVTTKTNDCNVSHQDSVESADILYHDILKIECKKSNSTGYYAKGKGLVREELKSKQIVPASIDRKLEIVDAYQPRHNRLGTLNLDSAIEAQADKLWAAPYYLNGQWMKIGLVDGGMVRDTHIELEGRVTNLGNEDFDNHATHTAGTMIAKGSHLPISHGFANDAEIYVYSYHDSYFADSIKRLFREHNVLISNHSYGYEGKEGLGEYDGNSRDLDIAVRENPYLIAVTAAGNDGGKADYGKWGLIKGGNNAKNVITVGALDDDSNHITGFSSPGPIKGGRMKPDIVMDGYNVLSTSSHDNTAYVRMDGTSMATPAATGTITLLAQRYQQVMDSNVRLDTMKAILFNTTRDVENPGPDYKSGFGRIDALKAVQVIDSMQSSSDSLVKLDKIHQGDIQRYYINSESFKDFKVTIAWVDDVYKDCKDCANDMLINDIDMVLIDESRSEKIYPFTLDENAPGNNAVNTKINDKDPQEQISVRLKPGNYILEIHGKKIEREGQDFTLVSSQVLEDGQRHIALVPIEEQVHRMYKDINQ